MAVRNSGGVGRVVLSVAAVLLLGTAAFVVPQWTGAFAPAAWAQEGGGDGGQGKGGQGQGGPGEESEGKGPKAGSGGSDGGKPVWAQEGIPEVDLGRLNVARSPDKVLDQALAEAVKSLTPEMVAYYNLPFDQVIAGLSLNFENVTFIDSPLQNLALLGDLLNGGTALSAAGVTTSDMQLAAMLLGAASDKTIRITPETVIAVTTILGSPITGTDAARLADLAESVRIAIVAGHG